MTYRLFYSPGACSLAPHIVLEEIGLPFELELISSRGEREGAMTATAEWRAMNPKGRIPALSGVPGSMGGAASLLTEVTAIWFTSRWSILIPAYCPPRPRHLRDASSG